MLTSAYIALLIAIKSGSHGDCSWNYLYFYSLYLFCFQCIYYDLKIAFPVQYVLLQLSTFMSAQVVLINYDN